MLFSDAKPVALIIKMAAGAQTVASVVKKNFRSAALMALGYTPTCPAYPLVAAAP
jgi:hypothetical protein